MTKYHSPIQRDPWHHPGDFMPMRRRDMSTTRDPDYRYHEIAHWLAGNEDGAEASYVTNTPTYTDDGHIVPACCRWERVVEDPLPRLRATLAGEAVDYIMHGIEPDIDRSHDRAHARRIADAYVQIYGGTAEEVIATAWQNALAFVREHRGVIKYLGDWLARKETLSGLELRIMLDRIDEGFTHRPKRKKRPAPEDLKGTSEDDLDETADSQEVEDIDEPMDNVIEEIEDDTYVADNAVDPYGEVKTKKKKKKTA
jgi:hypothetical protein